MNLRHAPTTASGPVAYPVPAPDTDAPPAQPPPRRWARLRRPGPEWVAAARYGGLVFLCVRVVMALLTVLAPALFPADYTLTDRFGRVQPAGWGWLLSGWERWDGTWYLRIIDAGYAPADDPPSAWFPGYPLVARALRPLVGDSSLVAALLVSNLAFLLALVVFHRLTTAEYGDRIARRSVLYLAISPVSFFLLAPYSESLFLLLALAVLYAARRQAWLVAGLAGALASGTRSAGALLALPVAVEALRAARAAPGATRGRTLLAGLGGAALVPLGMVAYLGYWQVRRGDAMFPLDVQRTSWGHEPWWPWRTLVEGARQGVRGVAAYQSGLEQVEFLLVAVILVLAAWVVWRAPRSYAVWTVASLLLPLSTPIPSRVLLSVPRYALVVFPLAWAAAVLSERYRVHTLVVAVSSGLLALLTVLHILGYPFF